jgi:hypothetical protein
MSKNKIFAAIYAIIGLIIILTPTYIFPVCASPAMGCRARTLPLVVALGVLIIIIAAVEFFTDK